jgi:4-hydroxyphenylacetate 3-monooxygenase
VRRPEPDAQSVASLRVHANGRAVEFSPARLVVAGFTGRDETSVRRHINELAALGVPAPTDVPAFYPVELSQLTFGSLIAVDGAETSGEVEPVLYNTPSGWFVGVGSDHTDRRLERTSIALSKQRCPKVASLKVLPLEEVEDRWQSLRLRSFADGVAYQDAPLDELLPPRTVLELLVQQHGSDHTGLVLFLGTVPVLDAKLRFAASYRVELADAAGVPILSHVYRLQQAPAS